MSKVMDVTMIVLGVGSIAGWMISAQYPNAAETSLKIAADRLVICTTPQQCDIYWTRAKQWVYTNTKYRVITDTNEIVETYNPIAISGRRSNYLSYKAYKRQTTVGISIDIDVECNSWFDNCTKDPVAGRAEFKQFVLATK